MIALRNYVRFGGPDLTTHYLATDSTLYTPIYISLFGGNIEADTQERRQPPGVENRDWWGNLFQNTNGEARYNSAFERTVMNTPFTSAAFREFERAISADLDWLIIDKIVKKMDSAFRIVSATVLEVTINVERPDGIEEKHQYLWDRS